MARSKKTIENSKPIHKMKIEKDILISMRDGIRIAADIYRPNAKGRFPALLAFSPFSKELQALVLTFPPQNRPNPLWDGCIEAGNPAYTVPRGYAHVIADSRGTGGSEGVYSNMGGMGKQGYTIGQDGYDMVEWIAKQPWCDGNVGMIGISIFAMAQIQTAAERPPHLKAIFPSGDGTMSIGPTPMGAYSGLCPAPPLTAAAGTAASPGGTHNLR